MKITSLLRLVTAALAACAALANGAPVHLVDEAPVAITTVAPGVVLVDFGKVAYGNLRITPPVSAAHAITLHFGEAFTAGRINRNPPGSVRYAMTRVTLAGTVPLVAAPTADVRNTTQPLAVLTPPEWGVVLPFRWVEIEGWPGELQPNQLCRQAAFSSQWDDRAAAFRCSDEMLNRIWELCHYSIKATTFAGIYVDGDRERIAYEGDAYINQLGHYASDNEIQMARDTFDRLMEQPTWPTEWASHLIFMAHADWMRTGDTAWLAPRFARLRPKLLLERARADGLLVSSEAQTKRDDMVDWPAGERDGFVFKPVNTVVNAFHLRSLALMAVLAKALDKDTDAADYLQRERVTRAAFQTKLFDTTRGVYRDGEGTDHASQHANLFPLAFGLVPAARRAGVTDFLVNRGMACSVYAAQYLLQGLFANDAGSSALALMTAPNDRSWRHMVESGTTITWEAWEQKFKPNQDWNHPWGTAPVNLLPSCVLGAQPLAPGWTRALIRPNPGHLQFADGKIPTLRGPILVSWHNAATFTLALTLPPGVKARVELPASENSRGVFIGTKSVPAVHTGARWVLEAEISGTAALEVK